MSLVLIRVAETDASGFLRSVRHYTLFEANPAADPADSLDSTHQDGSPRRPSSPDEVLRPTKRRRALNSPSSPMSPSSRSNDPVHELSALPADILLRIAEFLEPVVSPFDPKTGGGPSPSASWLDPGLDVMSFSATCRAIWLAVREVVGRRLVLRVDSFTSTGLGLAARLSSVIGEKEMDRLSARGEGAPRENTSVEDYLVSIGRTNISEEEKEEFVSRFRRSTHRIQSGRIRHLFIHTESPAALQHMDDIIARDMELMPRLETCSVVYMTEFDVIASSPYAVATLPATVLTSLTRRPRLRELYLCGVRIDHGMVHALPELDCPKFPQLKSLTINAAHDSALQIANLAPVLKEVKLWRDFARSARIHATGWWSEDLWRTLEHVELRGFSGSQGRPLHDDWKSSLKVSRFARCSEDSTLTCVLPSPRPFAPSRRRWTSPSSRFDSAKPISLLTSSPTSSPSSPVCLISPRSPAWSGATVIGHPPFLDTSRLTCPISRSSLWASRTAD